MSARTASWRASAAREAQRTQMQAATEYERRLALAKAEKALLLAKQLALGDAAPLAPLCAELLAGPPPSLLAPLPTLVLGRWRGKRGG